MAVVVVTDSSARLPADLLAQWDIRVVPLHVLVDGADLRDGVDDVPADLYQRAQASTAGASPAELAAVYRAALADSDGDGVVAVHLSTALSSTLGAAQHAAAELGGAVRVVDSRSAGMGTGFAALAAARAARAGADVNTAAAQAKSTAERTRAFLVVQRLDNLRRSGRIGATASWLGTALAVKPLLRIEDGRLVLAQRVRTTSKAIAAMVEQVIATVGSAGLRWPCTMSTTRPARPMSQPRSPAPCRDAERRSSPAWGRSSVCTSDPAPSGWWWRWSHSPRVGGWGCRAGTGATADPSTRECDSRSPVIPFWPAGHRVRVSAPRRSPRWVRTPRPSAPANIREDRVLFMGYSYGMNLSEYPVPHWDVAAGCQRSCQIR